MDGKHIVVVVVIITSNMLVMGVIEATKNANIHFLPSSSSVFSPYSSPQSIGKLIAARIREITHELGLFAACETEVSLKCKGKRAREYAICHETQIRECLERANYKI